MTSSGATLLPLAASVALFGCDIGASATRVKSRVSAVASAAAANAPGFAEPAGSLPAADDAGLAPGPGPAVVIPWAGPAPRPLPGVALNAAVLDTIAQYPMDGTFRFYWPGPNWRGPWAGTTADVVVDGEIVAAADRDGRTHCCGVTFEVAVRALRAVYRDEIPGLTALDAYRLRLGFCGDDKALPSERLVVDALEARGLGTAVEPLAARPGDFVQFWRADGSGHSAVFIDWLRGANGRRVGIRYWSSQAATDGIGVHEERFGGRRGVVRRRLHLARLRALIGP